MALEKEPARRASKVVRTFPAGLEPLYERMLIMAQQHEDDEEVGLRRQLLRVMVPSSQPLQVDEIRTIAGLEHELADAVAVEEATMVCGSFLTLRNATVAWIHQSAKDFFTGGNGMCIFRMGLRLRMRSLASDASQSCRSILNGIYVKSAGPVHRRVKVAKYWRNTCHQLHDTGASNELGMCSKATRISATATTCTNFCKSASSIG